MSLSDTLGSVWDTFNADTTGIFVRALTGNVDPWTYKLQVRQFRAQITQALGPNATQAQIDAATAQAAPQILFFLQSAGSAPGQGTGAAPGQCYLRLPIIGCVYGPSSDTDVPTFLAKSQKVLKGIDIAFAILVVALVYVALKKSGILAGLLKAFK